jgi:hypothetical protein
MQNVLGTVIGHLGRSSVIWDQAQQLNPIEMSSESDLAPKGEEDSCRSNARPLSPPSSPADVPKNVPVTLPINAMAYRMGRKMSLRVLFSTLSLRWTPYKF